MRLAMLAVAAVASAAALASSDDPYHWLSRMAEAARTLNYDGTFVYRNGDDMESMRIIHRVDPEGERSRLVALTGVAREVIRDHTRVTCILPDSRAVVVAKTRSPSSMPLGGYATDDDLGRYYDLAVLGRDRVAGRETEVVALEPRDRYRYGYRLWVDTGTGLLLRSDLLDDRGQAIEQFIYTSISLPAHIPDKLLEPSISGERFTWYTSEDRGAGREEEGDSRWQVTWVPDGFKMMDYVRDPVATSRMPVEQRAYTDGVASLSVFIEPLDGASEPLEGLSRMGAVNAYGRVVDGHQITVVGEVPARTVESVARSVLRQ